MVRVNFDLHTLLGDLLSPDGLFVDLLSCNEYTIWYLMRQAGLKGYVPVVRTKAFLTSTKIQDLKTFGVYQDDNLEILMANLQKYLGVGIRHFDGVGGNLHELIREALEKNQFVYTLYDHYFNTLADEPRSHDYHGHPITGYDDDRQIYLSLLPGKHEVRSDDLDTMLAHCYERFGTYRNYFFYLDSPICEERLQPLLGTLKEEIFCDCLRILQDWRNELDLFREYGAAILEACDLPPDEQREFALQQRLLFNTISEGMHGNFIFKLRLIKEVFHADGSELEKRFLENRKKGIMIANMYRKAAVLLDDGPEYYRETLQRIATKVADLFVRESEELLQVFYSFLQKEGLIQYGY